MSRVVVLQESLDVAVVVRHQLESDGFTVLLASDPDDVWKSIIFDAPEALILDLKILGSWDLLERIRADARVCRLAVVALTTVMGDVVESRAARLSAVFVPRPFLASSLLDRIQQAKAIASGLAARGGRIDTRQVRVTLLVGEGLRIDGTVHLAPEFDRFSDGWEAVVHDPRDFVPLTEAQVTSRAGAHPLVVSPFLEVRKADVQTVVPHEPALAGV